MIGDSIRVQATEFDRPFFEFRDIPPETPPFRHPARCLARPFPRTASAKPNWLTRILASFNITGLYDISSNRGRF
jgi:hypothetical protein